jgi:hypothetical protein
MADSIHRDVFRIADQDNAVRFGARFIGADGLEEKWSGEIPTMLEKGQLIGRIITNSEGKEYKVNKIVPESFEGKKHYQEVLWLELI